MEQYNFEGIKLSIPNDLSEMRFIMQDLLKSSETKYISFINPEIFLKQKNNNLLHEYFINAKYNFIDGVGLINAINISRNKQYNIQNRFPGTDFFEYLPEKKVRVVFYGSKDGVGNNAKLRIEQKYSNVDVVYTHSGYSDWSDGELINTINNYSPDILIVCLGCPKQEMFIKQNLDKFNVKLVFGNGGALDFWSGNVKRAPEKIINMGLEWGFRLFQDFTFARIRRQSKLIKFYFMYKFKKYVIEPIDSHK